MNASSDKLWSSWVPDVALRSKGLGRSSSKVLLTSLLHLVFAEEPRRHRGIAGGRTDETVRATEPTEAFTEQREEAQRRGGEITVVCPPLVLPVAWTPSESTSARVRPSGTGANRHQRRRTAAAAGLPQSITPNRRGRALQYLQPELERSALGAVVSVTGSVGGGASRDQGQIYAGVRRSPGQAHLTPLHLTAFQVTSPHRHRNSTTGVRCPRTPIHLHTGKPTPPLCNPPKCRCLWVANRSAVDDCSVTVNSGWQLRTGDNRRWGA